MASIKRVALLLMLILISGPAFASNTYGVMAGGAGFQGDLFVGGFYRFNDRHSMSTSLGTFTLEYIRMQLNVGYLYNPHEFVLGEHMRWSILDYGVNLSFSLDHDNYFLKSPVQYPQGNYYDQTRDRATLLLGSTLRPLDGRVSIQYFVALTSIGAIAFFNNREGYRQFLSSGITLQIPF